MRISDWSSDVCSSDLNEVDALALLPDDVLIFESGGAERSKAEYASYHLAADATFSQATAQTLTHRNGRAAGDLASLATESQPVGKIKARQTTLKIGSAPGRDSVGQ